MSYKYHSGQALIEERYKAVSKKLFVACVSRRFGKSTWACIKAIETAIKKKKSKSIIATAFQTDCENIILPIINEILSDCPQSLMPQFNKTKKRYDFKNGSSISIVGLDKNPNSLRGSKLNGVIILDESGFIGDLNYIYSSIIVPATMYSDTKIIMISTPPVSPEHPFKNFCEKAELENAYVTLTIFDNPMVTPEIIEEYRRECLTETDFQREYLCMFVTDSNLALVPEFSADKHVFTGTIRDEYFPFYRKYCAFDTGVNDPCAFLFAYYDWKKQKLVVEVESSLQGEEVLPDNIAKIVSQVPKDIKYASLFRTVSDSNDKIVIQDLNSRHGLGVQATSKDSLQAMMAELRTMFLKEHILVSDKCSKLINQLKFGIWKKDKSQFARQSGHHNDFIAALMYMVRNLSEHYSPIPGNYGYSQNTWNPSNLEPEQVQNWKKIFNL